MLKKMCFFLVTGALCASNELSKVKSPPAGELDGGTPRVSVCDEIRAEATRPCSSPEGRPLPLASSWVTGVNESSKGWAPVHQMTLIEQGHFILPWFQHPAFNKEIPSDTKDSFFEYYENPVKKAAELKLPLVFIASQWESLLSGEPYKSLPAERNSNVVTTNGVVLVEVSPFGPLEPWKEVGRTWTDSSAMKKLQEWYPDPPLVIFLSNNEHPKLVWTEAEKSARYLEKYGKNKDDDFKRKVIAEGWIERYRALQAGMRDGLASKAWKEKSIFVGYGAHGPESLGRWTGWKDYSLYVPGRMDPSPLMWDGGSCSFYTHNWNPSTDFTVWSPQIEHMNLVFQQKLCNQLNPKFWFEMSTWDGYTGGASQPPKPNDKRRYYASLGQTFTPERYAGMVQYGMWLLFPRSIREFRDWIQPWDDAEPYFMAIIQAVDRVHNNPVLREFWRKGELVPNRAGKHPYQNLIPDEYKNEDRWFLLDADCNPKGDLETFWTVPVFSLALSKGKSPQREWLVYAHAPLGDRKGVTLTIPGYGPIKVDVSIGGSFYVVAEAGKTVKSIVD